MARYEWTNEIDTYIITNFNKVPYSEMEKVIGIPAKAIYKRAKKIVPPLHRHNQPWTKMEDDLLLLHYGRKSPSEIAYILRRTETSVIFRVKRTEGLRDTSTVSGMLKTSDVAEIMGVDNKTVINWILNGSLNAYKPSRIHLIDETYFWEWVKDNTDRINYKRVETYILNTSPEWYSVIVKNKQREIYSNKNLNNYRTPYTSNDKALLLHLKNKGLSHKEIAKQLNRTYESVKAQYSKLMNKKYAAS